MEPIAQVRPVERSAAGHGAPVAALTVDVEDWYQSCFDYDAPITERVVRNTDALLALLDDCGVKATFFVQGLVAERFPELVRRLAADGHELGSHSHTHRPLHGMDAGDLREELKRARAAIEDAAGVAPRCFRAPDFSMLARNLWALEEIAAQGFTVDSSIFPMRSRHYGIPGWEHRPHRIQLASGASLLEVPVAIWVRGRMRIPVAGGGYFRFLPRSVLERGLQQVVGEGRPAIVYCHPYEFNPGEPDDYRGRVPAAARIQQRLGRESFPERLRRLFERFRFGRLDDVTAATYTL